MLTEDANEMLYRVALSEYFTEPKTPCAIPVPERTRILERLQSGGLIAGQPLRITKHGREFLHSEQRQELLILEARRRDTETPFARATERLTAARDALNAACRELASIKDGIIADRWRDIARIARETETVRDFVDERGRELESGAAPAPRAPAQKPASKRRRGR